MDFSNSPWQQISERVYLTRCEPERVNVGLVVGDEQILMIDSGTHPNQGRELAKSVFELANRRIDYLVLTHWHWDHCFGAPGIGAETVIAHENFTNHSNDAELLAAATKADINLDQLVIPNNKISLAKAADLGGVRVEILHFGPAHTDSDLMVVVNGENVIFVGDLLEEGADPQFGEDSKIAVWPSVLDGALGTANENTIFVPGHGKPVDRIFAFRQRAELGMLYGESERLARNGTSWQDAIEATEWPFSAETLTVALPLAYQELANKGIKPGRQLPLI